MVQYILTWDLSTHEDAQGCSKTKGQVDRKERGMGASAQHQLSDRTATKHLKTERRKTLETNNVELMIEHIHLWSLFNNALYHFDIHPEICSQFKNKPWDEVISADRQK